jgi:hypothetical protein
VWALLLLNQLAFLSVTGWVHQLGINKQPSKLFAVPATIWNSDCHQKVLLESAQIQEAMKSHQYESHLIQLEQ